LIRAGLQRFCLFVGAFAIAVGVAEVGARWLLPAPPIVHVAVDPDRESRLGGPGDSVVLDEKATLYVMTDAGLRLRPNSTVHVESHALNQRDVDIRTNSLGYRGPELGRKVDTRVLFLGDSITFGDWLPEEETFVRRVETLSRATGLPLETVNAGAGGISLANELAILLETGLSIDPDIVVVGFYLNDTARSRGIRPIDPPSWLAWSSLVQHVLDAYAMALPEKSPDDMTREEKRGLKERPAWLRQIRAEFPSGEGDPLESEAAFNRIIQKRIPDWGSAWSRKAWVGLESVFQELRRQAEQHRFQLLIVAFPVRMQVEADFVHDHPQRWLKQIADDLDVPMLDLLPLLRELHRQTDEPIFHDHCHHTVFGNERIADWVHGFVQAHR